MITVSNTFIPALKRRKSPGANKDIIADTEAGDVAYYNSKYGGDKDYDEDDFDYEDEYPYDDGAKNFSVPHQSITGADWRPKFNDRLTMFIAGVPGAGKSYLAKEMIKLLPSNIPIMLFTALTEKDGNFDSFGKDRLYKIKMTPENLATINLEAIRKESGTKQVILLFDDVDKIRDPKVQNATFAIMNDALANGRGHEKHDGDKDVHVICTSHAANDYVKTKYMFENSNYVALFPGATPPLQMYRMFDKLGLDKELCAKMIRLARMQRIRSIIVHKTVPMYLIYGDKIMLL